MSIVLSIIKSVRRQIGRRTLEFLISKKRGESLHWELSSEKLHYGYRKTYGLEKERGQQMPKQKLYTFILCGSAQMSSFFALKESSIYFCQSNMHKWKKGGVSKSLRPILESFLLVVSRDTHWKCLMVRAFTLSRIQPNLLQYSHTGSIATSAPTICESVQFVNKNCRHGIWILHIGGRHIIILPATGNGVCLSSAEA